MANVEVFFWSFSLSENPKIVRCMSPGYFRAALLEFFSKKHWFFTIFETKKQWDHLGIKIALFFQISEHYRIEALVLSLEQFPSIFYVPIVRSLEFLPIFSEGYAHYFYISFHLTYLHDKVSKHNFSLVSWKILFFPLNTFLVHTFWGCRATKK